VGGAWGQTDAKHAGAGTVRIGAGTFSTDSLGFRYDDPAPGNPVTVAGAGAGNTTLTTPLHDSATVPTPPAGCS
jgi:hypothetical protein